MKRRSIILAIALLFVVGAALWGVNYRLDHPPLTEADKEFRALVAGVDSAEINLYDFRSPAGWQNGPVSSRFLNASQTHDLVTQIRLSNLYRTLTLHRKYLFI